MINTLNKMRKFRVLILFMFFPFFSIFFQIFLNKMQHHKQAKKSPNDINFKFRIFSVSFLVHSLSVISMDRNLFADFFFLSKDFQIPFLFFQSLERN